VADDQFHQADKLRYKENKCKYGESQSGVCGYFTANVSIEEAHNSAGSYYHALGTVI